MPKHSTNSLNKRPSVQKPQEEFKELHIVKQTTRETLVSQPTTEKSDGVSGVSIPASSIKLQQHSTGLVKTQTVANPLSYVDNDTSDSKPTTKSGNIVKTLGQAPSRSKAEQWFDCLSKASKKAKDALKPSAKPPALIMPHRVASKRKKGLTNRDLMVQKRRGMLRINLGVYYSDGNSDTDNVKTEEEEPVIQLVLGQDTRCKALGKDFDDPETCYACGKGHSLRSVNAPDTGASTPIAMAPVIQRRSSCPKISPRATGYRPSTTDTKSTALKHTKAAPTPVQAVKTVEHMGWKDILKKVWSISGCRFCYTANHNIPRSHDLEDCPLLATAGVTYVTYLCFRLAVRLDKSMVCAVCWLPQELCSSNRCIYDVDIIAPMIFIAQYVVHIWEDIEQDCNNTDYIDWLDNKVEDNKATESPMMTVLLKVLR